MRLFLAAALAIAGFGSAAGAHSIGIADSVLGDSATVWLSNFHGDTDYLQGGIRLEGPGQETGGSLYAFDTVHSFGYGNNFPGFTGYDSGPFFSDPVWDWISVTISGLSAGDYTYEFTDAIGGKVAGYYGPRHGYSFSAYNGAFTIAKSPEVALATTPIPAALPLLGTGLALVGFLGWRRRKS